MLKVLVVDDEKLIRKGLISLLPWDKFDMQVIGEANNGRIALEFMKDQPVDFLFADITMPVMDGFELMKEVRVQYPATWIVVLTCHQDFDYVQEALRLGAIDYIIKTQFEQEKIEDLFDRIIKRVTYEKSMRMATAAKTELICGHVLANLSYEREGSPFGLPPLKDLYEVSKGVWFLPSGKEELTHLKRLLQSGHWALVHLTDIPSGNIPIICSRLRQKIPTLLFYSYLPGQNHYEASLASSKEFQALPETQIRQLEEVWHSQQWVVDTSSFETALHLTAEIMCDTQELSRILSSSIAAWQVVSGGVSSDILSEEQTEYWYQWEEKLKTYRDSLKPFIAGNDHSPVIMVTIAKALLFIDVGYEFSMNRDELAGKLLMSSSYFSQCFKDIVGTAYGDYVKVKGLGKAALLLEQTSEPVYQIALQTGYKDEKYFSKLFRNQYGLSPTEYRRKHAAGSL